MSNSLWIEEKDRQGTAYFELQKGTYDGTFGKKDSLLIHCDDFDRTGIGRVLRETSDFDYYGITEIDREIWERFLGKADEYSGDPEFPYLAEGMCMLVKWAEDCLENEGAFTIIGI